MSKAYKKIVAIIKKEMKLADKRLSEVMRTEATTHLQDTMLSIERAYADGYLEALSFIWDNLKEKPAKKKSKKSKRKEAVR